MIKQKNSLKKIILSLLFITSSTFLSSETFRVSKVHFININESTTFEETANLGTNDSLVIKLPDNLEYIEGLELKFSIPETIAYWLDSTACSLYENIKPTPKSSQIDYTGNKVYMSPLPNKLSWVLQIPIKDNNTIKSNNYTEKIDKVYNPKDNLIFIRIQPVMKGVPEETLNSIIPITVKPILINKGKLTLNLKSPDNILEPCSVFIDDEMTSLEQNGEILLPPGVHNISIISEAYRNEVRTIPIQQATETNITVEMKSIEPTLLITAPEGTLVILDEEECTNIGTEFVIHEGEHKIKFSIGNYEIIRSINAQKGKTYKANFSLDLQITEE